MPSGAYHCQSLMADGHYEKSALADFTLKDGLYTTRGGEGTYGVEDAVAIFRGGPFDGWRAATGSTDAGAYLRFRASSMGAPGDQTRPGDQLCFRAR